jgi:uncharacterized protein (TIGR02266 family)
MAQDTRKSKRAPAALKVRFRAATVAEFVEQQLANLSAGGIFIRSKAPLPRGTLLVFELQLQDGAPLIKGVGRVIWTRQPDVEKAAEPPGMGIKFIRIDAESRATFDSIMAGRDASGGVADLVATLSAEPQPEPEVQADSVEIDVGGAAPDLAPPRALEPPRPLAAPAVPAVPEEEGADKPILGRVSLKRQEPPGTLPPVLPEETPPWAQPTATPWPAPVAAASPAPSPAPTPLPAAPGEERPSGVQGRGLIPSFAQQDVGLELPDDLPSPVSALPRAQAAAPRSQPGRDSVAPARQSIPGEVPTHTGRSPVIVVAVVVVALLLAGATAYLVVLLRGRNAARPAEPDARAATVLPVRGPAAEAGPAQRADAAAGDGRAGIAEGGATAADGGAEAGGNEMVFDGSGPGRTMVVRSTPDEATVTINDQVMGRTPLTLTDNELDLEAPVDVRLTRVGCDNWGETIRPDDPRWQQHEGSLRLLLDVIMHVRERRGGRPGDAGAAPARDGGRAEPPPASGSETPAAAEPQSPAPPAPPAQPAPDG